MPDRERWIRRHLRLLRLGQFLERAGEWLAGFLIAFGLAVLLSKRLVPAAWPHVLWVLAFAAPLLGVAWWLSQRKRFTRDESVALLDRSLAAGGLLMTLAELPSSEWTDRLPQLEQRWKESLPRIRPRRFASCVAIPLLFALGVCFIPLRQAQSEDVPKTAGQQAAQRLESLLEAIKEARILEEKEEQALEEEIAKLTAETENAPLTHEKWETVDALEQRMLMELNRAELESTKLAETVAALAAALDGSGVPLSEEQLKSLEDQLGEALESLLQSEGAKGAAGSGKPASGKLKELLSKMASRSGTGKTGLPSDPAARKELLDDLRNYLSEEQKQLADLRKLAGECTNCKLGQCQGQCTMCGQQCEGGLCAHCAGGQIPGRGGVSRGRADAELTWGEEADEQGVKFKEIVLPEGYLEQPHDEVLGIKLTAPREEEVGTAARGAARDVDAATGRESVTRKLRPRHKDVVKQFFDAP